jgi:hypothetical protein
VKVFGLYDFDCDENITVSEVQAIFSELDGCFSDFDSFSQAMDRVIGSHTEDQKLTAVNFIAVRAEYSMIMVRVRVKERVNNSVRDRPYPLH